MRRGGMIAGQYYWPQTRIRKRGMRGYQNIRMRQFLKSSAVYVALIFVFVLGYVWLRAKVTELGYHIRSLEETQEDLKAQNHSLMVEAATLKSPQRLESLASQMGYKKPSEGQVYFVNSKKEIVLK